VEAPVFWGFEAALAEVQAAFVTDPAQHQADLDAMQAGIAQMFEDMNRVFTAQEFRFHFSGAAAGHDIIAFLARFDAIFTLNQDLLLEDHYLSAKLSHPYRYWSCHDLPGMRPSEDAPKFRQWTCDNWKPADPFTITSGSQPLFKLHGSSNWIDANDTRLMIIGGNKANQINSHPILNWYAAQFDDFLNRPNTRLMIIGYGFGDEHINEAINRAVNSTELRFFDLSPKGSGQVKSSKFSFLETMFEKGLIGASRRPLSSTFRGDVIEYDKVHRFFGS
jgi:hypothetical protein